MSVLNLQFSGYYLHNIIVILFAWLPRNSHHHSTMIMFRFISDWKYGELVYISFECIRAVLFILFPTNVNIGTAKKNQLCKTGIKSMKRWECENGKVLYRYMYLFFYSFIFIHNENCIQWCELCFFCVLWITKGFIKMGIILCLVKFSWKASSNQESCNYSFRIKDGIW